MSDSVIIIGASGHGKVVLDCIEKCGKSKVIGFLDRNYQPNNAFCGYPILGTEFDLCRIRQDVLSLRVVIAIGNNYVREMLYFKLVSMMPDLVFETVIHPSADLARGVHIGAGTVVMPGAVINSDSKIGIGCIVNTNASVDHDNRVNDFASLAPNSATGGNVTLGRGSSICIGASISHQVSIGDYSVVGAGSVVLSDVDSQKVVVGIPARCIRSRTQSEPYL